MPNVIFECKPHDKKAQKIASQISDLLKPSRLKHNLVIAIGGDGTMLHAIRRYRSDANIVFAGVSSGHLGFLPAVEPNELGSFVEHLENSDYKIIKVPLIAAYDNSGKSLGNGFNEILVERQSGVSAQFNFTVDDKCTRFIGDGMIFATPLGSTAYALAAGGPIIDESIQDVFVAVPSNPHKSMQYTSLQVPHVIKGDRKVLIEVSKEDFDFHPAQLTVDGEVVLAHIKQPISLKLSDTEYVNMLRLPGYSYYDRLEKKKIGQV